MMKTNEWGKFYPFAFSTFGYNKTTAQLYYPRTKEQALKEGSSWDENEIPVVQAKKTIPANALPDNSKDIPDDVSHWAIICEVTAKPFRITPQELAFYRTQNLPIPRRSPDQRHLDRLAQRNPRKLWSRICGSCGKPIQTTYAPNRPEKVYCEECYLKEVY